MQLSIGDLVVCREKGPKIGLVVDKRISTEGLTNSMHVRHMLNSYSQVYYVYFSGEGKLGPYHETELKIQQSVTVPRPLREEV